MFLGFYNNLLRNITAPLDQRAYQNATRVLMPRIIAETIDVVPFTEQIKSREAQASAIFGGVHYYCITTTVVAFTKAACRSKSQGTEDNTRNN